MTILKNDGFEHFIALSRQEWRGWLVANQDVACGVWLVLYKKHSGRTYLAYEEAVEEALCFGWIDNRANSLDEDRYLQKFAPRQPKSTCVKSNKLRVEKLIAAGLMTEAGLKVIELTKNDGSWDSINQMEDLILPPDLSKALKANQPVRRHFESLSDSVKQQILWKMTGARKPETRQKRIEQIVAGLETGRNPLQ